MLFRSMNESTTTSEFLIKIAQKLGKPPQMVEGLIKKLEDDWFDCAIYLKKIPDDMWKNYSIPERLLLEIKSELKTAFAENTLKVNNEPKVKDVVMEDVSTKTLNEEMKEEEMKEEEKNKFWENIIIVMGEEIDEVHEFIEALSILDRITTNIINSPSDPLKRKLRLGNPAFYQKVGRHPSALKLLFKDRKSVV